MSRRPNPKEYSMKMQAKDPVDGIYATSDYYVHAMEVYGPERFLFLSGTMGLDAQGKAPEGLEAQLELLWSNIRRILAEAGMTTDNIVKLTSFLRDASYSGANQAARIKALGDRRIPTTAVVVALLDPAWLVEIEVIAAG
jgi:2-iminobutanoate/2-iminopropanoate deaminase